jgi:hypothetical protein
MKQFGVTSTDQGGGKRRVGIWRINLIEFYELVLAQMSAACDRPAAVNCWQVASVLGGVLAA